MCIRHAVFSGRFLPSLVAHEEHGVVRGPLVPLCPSPSCTCLNVRHGIGFQFVRTSHKNGNYLFLSLVSVLKALRIVEVENFGDGEVIVVWSGDE